MATVHYAAPPPPPNAHALSRPRADAAALLPDDGSDSESVAESSCPGPYSRQSASSGFLGRDDDDDGCSSCVEGNELGGYHYQEADDDDDDDEVSTASVWWKKRLAAGDSCVFQPSVAREEAEDPERVAARQAEDRKFWEDCLGTGYP
ncbi:uncharacterized protein LOC124670597 [Lolium rigidum]|uniref:uncharacterized protein LOC124670597 n=1 Tax=Lolium rigidum TaxID=89674 RepID=UPI001F5D97EE|nr:uncharacterized protein LOC124670597 [Lolium rigidum]